MEIRGHINIDCRVDPPILTGKVHIGSSEPIPTEAQGAKVVLANALVRVRKLFSEAPHLRDNDETVPGCGGVTWRDLHELQKYAADKFYDVGL